MTVELVHTRKVCVITWDTETVKGSHASIQAGGEEKRNVENNGETNVFFPMSFQGPCEITVAGSKAGEDAGTIEVE
jgi:hypothetical protein